MPTHGRLRSRTQQGTVSRQAIPDVKGMGLKDALYLLESMDLKVAVTGQRKSKGAKPRTGLGFKKNETILIQLD
jgi:cell division protein FtsI (penicillin-binding protein 3)